MFFSKSENRTNSSKHGLKDNDFLVCLLLIINTEVDRIQIKLRSFNITFYNHLWCFYFFLWDMGVDLFDEVRLKDVVVKTRASWSSFLVLLQCFANFPSFNKWQRKGEFMCFENTYYSIRVIWHDFTIMPRSCELRI